MVVRNVTKLWGREFHLVPQGLAEADVVVFVEGVLAQQRELAGALERFGALGDLAERVVAQAERIGAAVREKARSEAEGTAATLVADAKRQAEKTLAEARRLAEAAAEEAGREAEGRAAAIVAEAEERRRSILADAARRAETAAQGAATEAEHRSREILWEARREARAIVSNAERAATIRAQDLVNAAVHLAHATVKSTSTNGHGTSEQATSLAETTPPHLLRWTRVPGATRYGVRVTRAPHGTQDVVFQREDVTNNTLVLPHDLPQEEDLMWTVRAGNEGGWGPFAPHRPLPP